MCSVNLDLLVVDGLPLGLEILWFGKLNLSLSLHMCLYTAVRPKAWWSYGQGLTRLMLTVVSHGEWALAAG